MLGVKVEGAELLSSAGHLQPEVGQARHFPRPSTRLAHVQPDGAGDRLHGLAGAPLLLHHAAAESDQTVCGSRPTQILTEELSQQTDTTEVGGAPGSQSPASPPPPCHPRPLPARPTQSRVHGQHLGLRGREECLQEAA